MITMIVERLASPRVESHPSVIIDENGKPLAAIVDIATYAKLSGPPRADLNPDDQ